MNDLLFAESFEGHPIRRIMVAGEPWWVAVDVCDILGYANSRKAILDNCHTKGVTRRDTLTAGGIQSLTCINEPNLYRLIARSQKPEAEKFEAWIFEEVIPTIRKTGSYSFQTEIEKVKLTDQVSIPHQIQNSKDVNRFKYMQGGRFAVINNNKTTQKEVTGKTPAQWKRIGKDMGLPARKRSSGKEVLRNVDEYKGMACAVSFADEIVAMGAERTKAFELARKTTEIYNGMLQLGIRPGELNDA